MATSVPFFSSHGCALQGVMSTETIFASFDPKTIQTYILHIKIIYPKIKPQEISSIKEDRERYGYI